MMKMKRFKKIIICMLLSLFIIPFSVKAESGEYFYVDDNLTVNEKAEHNLFVMGNTLNDRSVTRGILFALANDLNSDSKIDYGVMMGNNVTISSEIDKDLFLMGNTIKLNNATINRDAYIAGSSVRIINSTIDNTIFLVSQTLELDNVIINGDINVEVETLKIGDNVEISGKLYYNDDAQVTGLNKVDCLKETYKNVSYENTKTMREKYIEMILSILALLLVAVLITAIYSKTYSKVTSNITLGSVFKYMGLGLLLLIAVPIISILLMVSSIGLPLGLMLLVIYIFAIYLSLIWMGMVVGRFLHIKNRLFGTIVGVIIVKGLTYVPYAGDFLFLCFMLVGIGLMLKVMMPSTNSKISDKKPLEVTVDNANNEIQAPVVVQPVEDVVKEETNNTPSTDLVPVQNTEDTPKKEAPKKTTTSKKTPAKKTTTKKTETKKKDTIKKNN